MKLSALLAKLKELEINKDIEIAHMMADDALLEYIGNKEVRQAFDAIDKGYA